MSPEDKDLLPPRYRNPVLVASGGMGSVYRAVDEVLDRKVAVKLLAERFTGDESVRRRFRHEALAAARLSGEPDTVTIFDVGEWHHTPFIVMEYLGGGTLEQPLTSGAQEPARALEWLGQAARSLDAAHEIGVVHRDIKPSNLLLDDRGGVHVADFGIATAAGLDSLTLTGTILGTVGYLAPEQAQGQAVTAAADRYALAVVAYELLTGTRPFARETPTAEAAAHIHEPVPAATSRNPGLPRSVDHVLERALAKSPGDRHPTCIAFVTALGSALAPADADATLVLTPETRQDAPTRVIRRPASGRAALYAGAAVAALLAGAITASLLQGSSGVPGTAAGTTHVTSLARATAAKHTVATHPVHATRPQRSVTDASGLNTRGYELMLRGDYSAALPLLRQAVAGLRSPANPVTAYANFNLGQTLVRLGQCAAAIPYLQRALQLEPSRPVVGSALSFAQRCSSPPHPAPPNHGHGGPPGPPQQGHGVPPGGPGGSQSQEG